MMNAELFPLPLFAAAIAAAPMAGAYGPCPLNCCGLEHAAKAAAIAQPTLF